MAKALIVHDPYRNAETTLSDFAIAEGVKKSAVSHFYIYHGTLEGFRDRPPKGTGNGIKPHTFTYKGEFISVDKAARIVGVSNGLLYRWAQGTASDVEAIKAKIKETREARKDSRRVIVDGNGKRYTIQEYADLKGVSYSTVAQYMKNHGSVDGFDNRAPSRNNPTMYYSRNLHMKKSISEWAAYFGTNRESVKQWLRRKHGVIDGFDSRVKRTRVFIPWNGSEYTVKQLAQLFDAEEKNIRNWIKKHGSIAGFEKRKRGRPAKSAA